MKKEAYVRWLICAAEKIQFSVKKFQFSAAKIQNSAEKIQKITNRVDWILSKRVCDVIVVLFIFTLPTSVLYTL